MYHIETLISLLEKKNQHGLLTLKQCQDIEHKLFDVLPSSKHLQKTLFSNPNVLRNLPPQCMISKSINLLRNKALSEYAKSAVSKVLTHFIGRNTSKQSHEVVTALISCFRVENGSTEEEVLKLTKYVGMGC